jgi:tetratricopeptide (TPR) repeat protein
VWASPLSLWQDAVAKSPNKYRPHFQLAYALQYEASRCPQAVQEYERAAQIGPIDDRLLIDWALALDCVDRGDEAIIKLRQAAVIKPSAHVFSQIGMIYAKNSHMDEALSALESAEKIDAGYDMTYVYRGKIYEKAGNRTAAAREYQRALALKPDNQDARDSLLRVSR